MCRFLGQHQLKPKGYVEFTAAPYREHPIRKVSFLIKCFVAQINIILSTNSVALGISEYGEVRVELCGMLLPWTGPVPVVIIIPCSCCKEGILAYVNELQDNALNISREIFGPLQVQKVGQHWPKGRQLLLHEI